MYKRQIEDYVKTAEVINELDKIPAIELNISCPNVQQDVYKRQRSPSMSADILYGSAENVRNAGVPILRASVLHIGAVSRQSACFMLTGYPATRHFSRNRKPVNVPFSTFRTFFQGQKRKI